MGVCALAGSEAAGYGAAAAQETVEGRGGDPSEGMERSCGLLVREVGGIGPRPRLESIPIDTYAVPIPPSGLRTEWKTVLAFVRSGDPDRIRTGDLHRDRVAC